MQDIKSTPAKKLVIVSTAQLLSEYERLESHMKKMSDDLLAHKASAEADRAEFKQVIIDLLGENRRLRESQVFVEEQEQVQAHSVDSMAALQQEIAILRSEIAQRDQVFAESQELILRLREELEKEKMRAKAEQARMQEGVEQLRTENTQRNQKIIEGQQRLDALKVLYEEKVQKDQPELAELKSSVKELEQKQVALSEEKFDCKLGTGVIDDLSALRKYCASLEDELKKMQEKSRQFKQNVSEEHQDHGRLIADFHDRIHKAEIYCRKLGNCIDTILSENKTRDQTHIHLEETLSQFKSEVEELRRTISVSSETRNTYAQDINNKIERMKEKNHSDIESLSSELKALRDAIKDLQSENERLRLDLAVDSEKMHNMVNAVAKATEESKRNKEELLRSKSEALQDASKREDAMASLKVSLHELQVKYERAEKERKEQQSEITRLRARQEKSEDKLTKDQEMSKLLNSHIGTVATTTNGVVFAAVSQNPNGHFSGKSKNKQKTDVDSDVGVNQKTKTHMSVKLVAPLMPKSVSKEKVTAATLNSTSTVEEVSEFFELLKLGLKSQVRGCLMRHPDLIRVKIEYLSIDEKKFTNITGFQYALHRRDIELCRLFLSQLTPEEARKQKSALQEAITIPPFSFDQIIEVIEYYRQNCMSWNVRKRIEYWAHTVGSAQASLPAWVIHLWSESGEKVAWTLKDPTLEFFRQREWIQIWFSHFKHILGDKTNNGMGWSRGLKNQPEAVFADGQLVPSEMDADHQVDFLRKVALGVEKDFADLSKSLDSSSFFGLFK